jgi:hypothetical protein
VELEQMLEELAGKARAGADKARDKARDEARQRSRLPGLRRRMRTATLWVSTGWVSLFAGLGIASEVAIDGGVGTVLAVAAAGIALPGIPTGIWAWRARARGAPAEAEALAARGARKERAALPRAVASDWVRLRRAQQLVEDLASRGLVDVGSISEQGVLVEELRALLVADRRSSELGGAPSAALRQQVADLGDLLVALAVEAVEAGSEAVDASSGPATLRDARERLATLRDARVEVAGVEVGADADAAQQLIEQHLSEQHLGDQHLGDQAADPAIGRTVRRRRPSRDGAAGDASGTPEGGQPLEG